MILFSGGWDEHWDNPHSVVGTMCRPEIWVEMFWPQYGLDCICCNHSTRNIVQIVNHERECTEYGVVSKFKKFFLLARKIGLLIKYSNIQGWECPEYVLINLKKSFFYPGKWVHRYLPGKWCLYWIFQPHIGLPFHGSYTSLPFLPLDHRRR